MKIIAVVLARTGWMFDIRRLNPRGRSFAEVLQLVGGRYHFSSFPKHMTDYNKNGALEFSAGTFTTARKEDVAIGFSLYNNGWVADALSSTDDSEEFLQDVTSWIAKEHGFELDPSTRVNIFYLSQMDIELDGGLRNLNPRLEQLSKNVTDRATTMHGKSVAFRVSGFSMWGDDMGKPLATEALKIERKWGSEPEDNLYFSQAPMTTKNHVLTLSEIETILSQ